MRSWGRGQKPSFLGLQQPPLPPTLPLNPSAHPRMWEVSATKLHIYSVAQRSSLNLIPIPAQVLKKTPLPGSSMTEVWLWI